MSAFDYFKSSLSNKYVFIAGRREGKTYYENLIEKAFEAGVKAGMERAAEIIGNHTFMVSYTTEQLMPQLDSVIKAIRKEIENPHSQVE